MMAVLTLVATSAAWLAAAGWTVYMLWRHLPVRPLDWGEHLLRIALLLVLPALSLSFFARYRQDLVLAPGQREHTPAGVSLELTEIRDTASQKYSQVRVRQPGRDVWSGRVAVNSPLRIGPYRLYQLGFEQRPGIILAHSGDSGPSRHPDSEILLAEHEGFRHDGVLWILARDTSQAPDSSTSTDDAWFFRGRSEGGGELRMSLSEGARALGMQPAGSEIKTLSRLRLADDPGAVPAAAAAVLLLAGALLLGLREIRREATPVSPADWTFTTEPPEGAEWGHTHQLKSVDWGRKLASAARGAAYPLLTAGLLILPGVWGWQHDGVYWGWSWSELGALAVWLAYTAYMARGGCAAAGRPIAAGLWLFFMNCPFEQRV